jgi:Ran GTPase-activating protein (RanGAP) involved in mRNA processing and transport
VRRNRISATGAEALASLLMKHFTVLELDLEANRITNDGARALGLALKHNHSLRV